MDNQKLAISYFNLIDSIMAFDTQRINSVYMDVESVILNSMKRDIQNLLNTRIPLLNDESSEVLSNSLLAYGIQDFSGFNPQSNAHKEKLRESILRAIETFDHRLKNVKVEILGNTSEIELNVQVSISAVLQVPSTLLPVYFNFVFDPVKTNFQIKEADYA